MTSLEEAFADLNIAIVETLEPICRQLAERGFLNVEMLVSDLIDVTQDLEKRNIFEGARVLPHALASYLAPPSADRSDD
jgi:hypothetical protein